MNIADYVIIAVYFGGLVVASFCFRGQNSLREYFLGGGSVPWWAAMGSGVATIVSAVSYLGGPGVAFQGDFTLHQYRLGLPFAIVISCVFMLPHFFRAQRYSLYEYLEERFDLKTRLLASGTFLTLKVCYVGVAIYAPTIILRTMVDAPVWLVVLLVGGVTTIYTVTGGVKAVVWTDVAQLLILLLGLVVVAVVAVGRIHGGLETVLSVAEADSKLRFFDFRLDLTTPYTFWTGLICGGFLILTQFGTDQSEMQRFMATRTLRDARIALVGTLLLTFVVGLAVFFVGTVLYSFYVQHPEKGAMAIASNDVMPKFIIEELPAGLKGLLLAAVFSAAMSTISSVLNSLATVAIADFYNRFAVRQAGVGVARLATLGFGVLGMIAAVFSDRLGNIVEMTLKISSFFGGPLVGLFLLGMLTRRPRGNAAFLGLCVGLSVAVLVGSSTRVAFLWWLAFSAIATFAAGYLAALAGGLLTAKNPDVRR